jgi:hypothetical protein
MASFNPSRMKLRTGIEMPKGPNGQKRPADAIGLAVMIGKIATGEVEDTRDDIEAVRRLAGQKGGAARAASLSPAKRKRIASLAAKGRWETQALQEQQELKETTSE